MLQTQTVNKKLLELLNQLMQSDVFQDFNLVGGTALALQIGHRSSVDIDLFGKSEFNTEEFIDVLSEYDDFTLLKKSSRILIAAVNDIKVDIVNINYLNNLSLSMVFDSSPKKILQQ